MRLTMTREQLAAALDVVRPAIKPRSTHPVLANVLLSATADGGLHVAGTDLETRAWQTVPADVTEAGSVTLPSDRLLDFLAAIPDGAVFSLVVDEAHKASLSCGKTQSRVAGIDAEQFPPELQMDGAAALSVELDGAAVASAVGCVAHALAPNDSRPVLAGLLLRVRDERLTLVAADGYRLAITELSVDAPDLDIIAAGKPLVQAVARIAQAGLLRLTVPDGGAHVVLASDAGSWAVRVIDGQYPDFIRIIPRDPPTAVLVARADLLRAVRLVRQVESTSDGFCARLTIRSGEVEVRAGSSDGDQAAETVIGAELVRGSGMAVAFNSKYLHEAVEAVDAEQVLLELSGPASPAILRDSNSTDTRQIVMPMHVARPS